MKHSPGSFVRDLAKETVFFTGVKAGSPWSFGGAGGGQRDRICLRDKPTQRKSGKKERKRSEEVICTLDPTVSLLFLSSLSQ